MLAVIDRHQPYQRGDRAENHWLAILNDLSNTEKHQAFVLHTVYPERRYWRVSEIDDFVLEIDGVDHSDGGPAEPEPGLLKEERRIVVRVTFAERGTTGQRLDVDYALRGLLDAVRTVINELSPFLA